MNEILGLLYYGCRKCQGLFPNVCELTEHMFKCTGVKILQRGVHLYAYESSHLKKFMECLDKCSHTEDCPFQNCQSGSSTHQPAVDPTVFYVESDTLEQNRQGQLGDCATVVVQNSTQKGKALQSVALGTRQNGREICMANFVSVDTDENGFLRGDTTDLSAAPDQATNGLIRTASENSTLRSLLQRGSLLADTGLSVSRAPVKEQTIAAALASLKALPMGTKPCHSLGPPEPLTQPSEAPSSATQKLFTCVFCSHQFLTKATYTRHVLTHTDQLFRCSQCRYSCGSQQQLTQHEEEHRELVSCEVDGCSHKSKDKLMLRAHHIMTHANKQPKKERVPCKVITTNATTATTSLPQHSKGDTSKKQFQCTVCHHSTSTEVQLKVHVASHKRKTQYACNECDFRCSQRSAMTSHVMDHRGMLGWQCLACGFMGGRKCDVHKHILKRHKEYSNVNDALVNLGTKLNLDIDQYKVKQMRPKGKPQPSESKVRVKSKRSKGKTKSSPREPESEGEAVSDTVTAQPSNEPESEGEAVSDTVTAQPSNEPESEGKAVSDTLTAQPSDKPESEGEAVSDTVTAQSSNKPESEGEVVSETLTAQPSNEDNTAIDAVSDLQYVSQSDNIDMECMMNPDSEINIQDLLALECHINIEEGLDVYDIQDVPMGSSPNTAFSEMIPWALSDCPEFAGMEILGDEETMDNKFIGDGL